MAARRRGSRSSGPGRGARRSPRLIARREPVAAAVPLAAATAARIARRTRERARACPGSSCRTSSIATADPARRSPTRPISSSFAVPSAHVRSTSTRSAPPIAAAADVLSVVKGLERGTLLRMSEVIAEAGGIAPGADRGAVRAEPGRRDRARPAGVGGRGRDGPGRSASRIAARLGRREFRLYVERGPARRRALRSAEERRRDRGRGGRRARLRRQRQGRA